VVLASPRVKKEGLASLCSRVFKGDIFKSVLVDSAAYGAPYASANELVRIDVPRRRFIADSQREDWADLLLQPRTTLVTCSGMNLGEAILVHDDMADLVGSPDLIRVIPDERRIRPEYLFAFFKSRFGWASIRQFIYGTSIRHVSPDDLLKIEVPRLAAGVEDDIADKVADAAKMRVAAARDLTAAIDAVDAALAETLESVSDRVAAVVRRHELSSEIRLDAFHFNPTGIAAARAVNRYRAGSTSLKDACERIFDVPPFKHIYVAESVGIPFYTSAELFLRDRTPSKHLSRTETKGLPLYILQKGWLLLARSGQIGGVIGRLCLADSFLDGKTTSDHIIRLVPKPEWGAGFLWACLSSERIGYPVILRTAAGASVPALWPEYLESVPIPNIPRADRLSIDVRVTKAFELRGIAHAIEQEAIRQLTSALLSHRRS
jgi:type I restriction enzyme S subunit